LIHNLIYKYIYMSLRGFDWEYYLEKYPDLYKAGINCKKKAIIHYQKYGVAENRFPNKNVEIMNKRIEKRNITKINKSYSSKEYDLSSRIKEYDNSSESKKSNLEMKNDILNLRKDINTINDKIEMILKKINLFNNNKIIENEKINKFYEKNISRIESSEEYELNNENSEKYNIIANYSNSEENNVNDKSNSNNFNEPSDSFSENLSYDK